jgi:hypothetical protein
MKLVTSFIVFFVLIGMTAPAFTKQTYTVMVAGIVVVVVMFYVLWFR